MSEQTLPKPNTQALSWFYGEHQKDTLVLAPKYQRNPIWSIGQKCFLIDSLISQCPIPQVFLNVTTEGKGAARKTCYEVVDGQQRLSTILDFMSDKWALISMSEKSYPVSDGYRGVIGKRYSDLPSNLQDLIWNYPLAVQELRGWGDVEIRALFRRLNYVVERLSKQELRHSQYFGEFAEAVEDLAQDPFWDEIEFFGRRDYARMKDAEFVSELLVLLMDGVQEGQSTLDRFYADYDVVFPKRSHFVSRFHTVVKRLYTVGEFISDSRFSKKADFYALFGAVARLPRSGSDVGSLDYCLPKLKRLASKLSGEPAELEGEAARYYQTVIEGPNKKGKRKERIEILSKIVLADGEG